VRSSTTRQQKSAVARSRLCAVFCQCDPYFVRMAPTLPLVLRFAERPLENLKTAEQEVERR
jgi:hypothetical protein